MDRLYLILWEGLQIRSEFAQLQAHGALHGPGIYTAKEISISAAYTNWPEKVETRKPIDFLVMLVCELSNPMKHRVRDDEDGATNFYLTSSPKDVIVRAFILADSRDCFNDIDTLELEKYHRKYKQ
jgi:hypothetical protein